MTLPFRRRPGTTFVPGVQVSRPLPPPPPVTRPGPVTGPAATAAAYQPHVDRLARLAADIEQLTRRAKLGREAYRAWARPRIAENRALAAHELAHRDRALAQIAADERELAERGLEMVEEFRRYQAARGRSVDTSPLAPFELQAVQIRRNAGRVGDAIERRHPTRKAR